MKKKLYLGGETLFISEIRIILNRPEWCMLVEQFTKSIGTVAKGLSSTSVFYGEASFTP